jgi:hypothetical protein
MDSYEVVSEVATSDSTAWKIPVARYDMRLSHSRLSLLKSRPIPASGSGLA